MNFLLKAILWCCLAANVMQYCVAEPEQVLSAAESIQTLTQQLNGAESKEKGPLLVVVIMAKNEEGFIEDTLQPFVDAGLQDFVLLDTGSTDSTIAVTREFFKKNNVAHGVIEEEAFVNFEVSRNRSLEFAEQHFPQAAFFLVVDAEWYVHDVKGLISFCEVHKHEKTPLYLVRIMNDYFDNYTPRLFRRSAGIRFVGAIHEVPNWWTHSSLYEKVQPSVFFEWRVSEYGHEKSKRRYLRDREILLKECENKPTDARSHFYLAQTYRCLDDLENARMWYEKRVALNQFGWDEENFIAVYHLGHVYHDLGMQDQAILKYLEAATMRPCRAEPLICLASLFWEKGNPELAYLFASRAAKMPYPDSDVLFVDKKLYDYTRYDLLGITAWYVGEHEEGKAAVIQALKEEPKAPHLHRNLILHAEQCAKKSIH